MSSRANWRRGLARAFTWAAIAAACTNSVGTDDRHAHRTLDCVPSVTTDSSSYTIGDEVDVNWDCTPGNYYDWVVITEEGSGCPGQAPFQPSAVTQGSTADTAKFIGTVGVGTWVARVYENLGCTLLAESDPFEVTDGSPTVTVDDTAYGPTDSVMVTWSGLPGNTYDYISIAHFGAHGLHYVAYHSTGGSTSGSYSFPASAIGPGEFIARAQLDNSTVLLADSDTFSVSGVTYSVSADAPTYAFGEPVLATWSLSGALGNYIDIMPSDSSSAQLLDYYDNQYVGTATGSRSLTHALPPGTYLLRAYENNTGFLLAESETFEVVEPGGPTINAPEVVPPSSAFAVSWTDMPTITTCDWLAITPWGAPTTYEVTACMGGLASGSHTVTPGIVTEGRYLVRAFGSSGWYDHLVATDEMVVSDDPICVVGDLPAPDGTSCDSGKECFEGLCVATSGACGNGVRNHSGMSREGCDDGYTDDDDACSATCEPTALIVATDPGLSDLPAAQLPAMAEDGTGRLLFVWLTERLVAGELTRDLVARRYTSAGHPIDQLPIVIESDVGSSQRVRPSVTGLASGWAVTWRSERVEPAGSAEQGGIALSILSHDGVVGRRRQVNESTHLEQTDPVVVALDTMLVVVWSDFSGELTAGDLRMRTATLAGVPQAHEQGVATTTAGDQSGAFAIARHPASDPGGEWAVAWTTLPSDVGSTPEVHMRRYDGTLALDASELRLVTATGTDAWGSEVALAVAPDGYLAAWTRRSTDVRGDVAVLYVADGGTPDDDMAIHTHTAGGTTVYAHDGTPTIAMWPVAMPGDEPEYVVAYESALAGGTGVLDTTTTLPAEADDLADLIASRQRSFSMLPTERGLWLAWADPTLTSATDAFVAYLLPWD